MSLEIRYFSKNIKDMTGGIVLDGFPNVGLINSIALECLIQSIETDLIGVLDCQEFPALSIINNYIPNFPARIYLNEKLKASFFLSELNIDPAMYKSIARTIIKWAIDNKCKLILSAAGFTDDTQENTSVENISATDKNVNLESTTADDLVINNIEQSEIFAVTSTPSAAKIIKDMGFNHMKTGTVTGIPAVLLNEGFLLNQDVIVFLVKVQNGIPDFRAAALLTQAITKFLPEISCDIGSLMIQAKIIERKIRDLRDHAKFSFIK